MARKIEKIVEDVTEVETTEVVETAERPLGAYSKNRAKRGTGIGAFICNALLTTERTYDEIVLDVHAEFEKCATSKACVSWYMAKMKKGKYGGVPEGHARLA